MTYALPVQHCPICGSAGVRLQSRPPLLFDARCSACGWYYTSTAHRMVLRALKAHEAEQQREVR